MLCEEKLEIFENGFEDGKLHLRIEFYGKDARKILLSVLRELYLPDYGEGYVYPFECAREFWGVYTEPAEIRTEEFHPNPVKFINPSLRKRLENAVFRSRAPEGVRGMINVEDAEVHRTKKGLLALGRSFILREDGLLITFNKPSARGLILKYLGMADED